jgi:hypothetical protein
MPEYWTHITAIQDDDSWFEDYCRIALACEPPKLPERTMRLGAVQAGWFPIAPGMAHIFASGGTSLDRRYAYILIASQLEGHGIKPASYSLDWNYADEALIKEAGWPDIQAKATRLIKSGKVKIVRNAKEIVAGVVEGDHGTYNTEIQRNDPNSQAISMWTCECSVAGNMIVMADGTRKAVEDIQVGDRVLTAIGTIGIVGHTMSRYYEGDIFGFCMSGSSEMIWVTGKHRLLTPEGPKEAKDWDEHDRTFLPQPVLGETKVIRVTDFVSGLIEQDGWLYKPNKLFGSKRVRKDNRPQSEFSPHQKPIPAEIDFDENFARLGGLFVAEGIATARGELRWAFNANEPHLAKEVVQSLDPYGIDNAQIRQKGNCLTVAVQSKPLSDLFVTLFGTGSHDKKLHPVIMSMPKHILSIFFDAWVEGDGHLDKHGHRYLLATVSDNLAMQARLILAKLECQSVIRRQKKNSSPLVPNGGPINYVEWRVNQAATKGNIKTRFENAQVVQKMRPIARRHFSGTVYNFEVLDEHSYVFAPGISSKNCKWDQFAWQRTRQWKRLEGRVCVMPGTLVTLKTGEQIPIEEVQVDDLVLTHNGIGRVTQTMQNDYMGRVFSIYRFGFPDPLEVTENHEVWSIPTPDSVRNAKYNQDDLSRQGFKINDDTFLKQSPQWVDSQDLRVHDWVASTWVQSTPLGVGHHFATAFGYYLAEGNFAWQNGKPTEIQWTFHEDETDLHDTLTKALGFISNAKVRTYKYPDRSVVSIRITDHYLAEEFLKLGGHYAREKKLAPSVLRWSIQDLETLLEAHYQGDGTYNRKDARLTHYTASDELARQLFDILVKCGYIPSWQRATNNGGPQNREAVLSMNRIAYKRQKTGKGNGRRRFENRYMSKITKIEEYEYEGPVYNLAVDDQESYVANGVVVHNCSHVLATYWQALATPLDEEIGPGSEGPQEPQPGGEGGAPAETGQPAPGAQPSPFAQVPGGGTGAVPPAGAPGPQKPGMPNQVAPVPQPSQVPGQAPEPQSLIPQYPHDPALQPAINPVSVPGQKPQTPLNPMQNPGGTFSHIAAQQFTNGDMVQLKQADHGQTVGLNAGEIKEIPMNSIGEVLGTDPLGLVNVYFAGPQAEAGRMEAHGVTGWFWPNDLILRSDVPPAGPAVRRR